jgi:xanthine dehydrogenase accessory factor
MNKNRSVLVIGGGLFGSAITVFLARAGLEVILVIDPLEAGLRRNLCFSDIIATGKKEIEQIQASFIDESRLSEYQEDSLSQSWKKAIRFLLDNRTVPVFFQNEFPDFLEVLNPAVIVATQEEKSIPFLDHSAGLVIGLYPFYDSRTECQLLIEARSNYYVGQIISDDRLQHTEFDFHFFKQPFQQIHAPLEGIFTSLKNIGEPVSVGDPVGSIAGIEIRSPYAGQIWGLLHSGRILNPKQPMALVYEGIPHPGYKHFEFKQIAVAGSVLKEILYYFS